MSFQDYEFLTKQMTTIIELDKKKRTNEIKIETSRVKIKKLQSSFKRKFSKDVPDKPVGWENVVKNDVSSYQQTLQNLQSEREKISLRVTKKSRFVQVALLILGGIAIAVLANWSTQPIPWECDSGEEIFTKQLLDGTEDCSDGSDEYKDDSWWDRSDAERHVHDDRLLELCGGLVLIIGIFIMPIWYVPELLDEPSKKEELDRIDAGIKVHENGIKYSKWKESKSQAHTKLNTEINEINDYISSLSEEIVAIVNEIEEIFGSVSHLTPYSDRVIFGESKILGNNDNKSDS